jgi:MarR family transcriptional regulator, 2-MHQ and catechol-resistance regulon repressor
MRSQRKRILLLTEAMLDAHERLYPEHYERNATQALFAIRALAQRIADQANQWLGPLGLNAAKYNYLVVIALAQDQQLTLNEISLRIHTSNATVTSMVGALERDGLVERRPNPADRRSSIVRLTVKGRQKMEKAVSIHHRNLEQAMRTLSVDERKLLVDLLRKVAAGFEAD